MHLSNALSLVTLMKYQSTWQSIHSFTLLPMILWVVIEATHLHPQFKAGKALLWTYSGSSIEEFSNRALVRYIQQTFTTADGLEHGCQQQLICESEPHYGRFPCCLAFQSYKNVLSPSWQPWTLTMKLHHLRATLLQFNLIKLRSMNSNTNANQRQRWSHLKTMSNWVTRDLSTT